MALKETKELLKFAVALGESIDKATEDNKIDLLDAPLLMAPVMAAGPAFENAGAAKSEVSKMTAEEVAELVKFCEEELELRSDRTEEIIESALKVGADIHKYVQLFKSLKKK